MYGRKQLQLYVVGVYPIERVSQEIHRKMLRFSWSVTPNKARTCRDENDLEYLQRRLNRPFRIAIKKFLLAFGAPFAPGVKERQGHWYKIPAVPDSSVDLNVYVPSPRDRIRGEIRIPRSEFLGVSIATSRSRPLSIIIAYVELVTGTYKLVPRLLTCSGLQYVGSESIVSGLVIRLGI